VEIERGLHERAVSDPRAAEILPRWLQRPRTDERIGGIDLDSMSQRELERLHAGLLKLAACQRRNFERWLAVSWRARRTLRTPAQLARKSQR
jgi:hypothetical protein